MQTIRSLTDLRDALAEDRREGRRIALVPTMGALHAGHLALVAQARQQADRVVVSIFVNPKQFGPNEDFARYPRREAQDAGLLAAAGVDVLWMPSVEVMYPNGFATTVSVSGVSETLDGAARPGHFDGVATVVTKLFNQVRPDIALFGEKDFQQLAVITRLAHDLDMGIAIVGVPTERDDDGLALSSRNAYLSADQRAAAIALPRALGHARATIEAGGAAEAALAEAVQLLGRAGFVVDYVSLVDAATLGPYAPPHPGRILAAARMGETRLIDNLPVNQRS